MPGVGLALAPVREPADGIPPVRRVFVSAGVLLVLAFWLSVVGPYRRNVTFLRLIRWNVTLRR